MSIPTTEILHRLGHLHRFIAGGCYGILRREFSRVFQGSALRRPRPEEVPVSDWFNPSIVHHILCRSKAVLKC